MKRRSLLLGVPAALLVVSGCGGGGDQSANGPAPTGAANTPAEGTSSASLSGEKKGVIGLSVLTLTNPFFKVIADTMTEEAAKHGYEVQVVDGNRDVAKQQNQVKDFIVNKVVAIVLNPCDSKAIGEAIKEANSAGIPVFTADIKCLAPDAKVVSHIATDNHQGGKVAGEAMVELLKETGGEVGILDFKQVESCIMRVQGFKEVVDAHNKTAAKKIKIVSELNGGGVKDEGYKSAEDMLQQFPNMAALFAINDPSALGARAAFEKAGKADQVKIIGFDGQPEGKQAIKEGKIHADPIQFPDRIAKQTVDAIIKHLEGEEVPAETLIPTELYTKKEADADPELK